MKTRFLFDVEAQGLHKEGFAYGYVVAQINTATMELTTLEQGECYSILGAKGAGEWVQKNVLPALSMLTPYLAGDTALLDATKLPNEIVLTTKELRDKFYETYMRWKAKDTKENPVEFWSDVNFPVETNFLSAVVADGNGDRDWKMPYPLHDVANDVHVDINRANYSGLVGLREHNPLDDSLASLYSLHNHELAEFKKNKLNEDKKVANNSASNDEVKSEVKRPTLFS